MSHQAIAFSLDDEREAPYRRFILEAAPRLLGQLDREPLSPTWGSFDRDHWAWKFRDFPVILLQAGLIPLSWLHARPFEGNVYHANDELRRWIVGSIDDILTRQHRNGAFDTVSPNSQDHGVTLLMVYTLTSVLREMGEQIGAERRARVLDAVHRGCQFAARSEEDYAFISNHHALFALAWLRAGLLAGDASLIARADDTIAQIIARQSPEGWYLEYGGNDPGYESLGIQYLALALRDRHSPQLESSLAKSVAFYAHTVHPDGSVGGGIGSRDTRLWYPGGFELLAPTVPMAASIADFLRRRLDDGNVVTPRNVDPHNLPTMLAGYCTAMEAQANRPTPAEPVPALPFATPHPLRVFNESGLAVAGTQQYHAVVNLRKGGLLVVLDRSTGQLLHEDAGYVVRSGGTDWTTALLGEPETADVEAESLVVRARFAAANREVLTPVKFLILRTLNLTLFRSVWLGALIRRMIIARIITGRSFGPHRVVRRIDFAAERVTVRDEIESDNADAVTAVWRPRSYQAQHMGSARYFHQRDLQPLSTDAPEAPTVLAERLRQAGRLTLQFVVSTAVRPRTGSSVASADRAHAVPDVAH